MMRVTRPGFCRKEVSCGNFLPRPRLLNTVSVITQVHCIYSFYIGQRLRRIYAFIMVSFLSLNYIYSKYIYLCKYIFYIFVYVK